MSEPITAYIGLGSNLGDRQRLIRQALELLGGNGSIRVTRVSDIRETTPLGQMDQPNYLNGVAEIRTALKPQELLRKLKAAETALGRRPGRRWQSRPIDLDLLLFADRTVNTRGLVVPHPQMHLRSFVLDGLCQLDPGLMHPLLQEPVSELSRRLAGGNFVLDPDAPQVVSVAGLIGVGKTTLAKKLAEVLPGEAVYEPYGANPFLAQVYAGKTELGLDSQLYFLVHRAEQLDRERLPRDRVFVTDYVFDKELIYARRLLDPEQLKLYMAIFPPFARRVATPALVIYLEDSPQACLARIHSRNRPYEQKIAISFLESLNEGYKKLFDDWKACPVIRIPSSRLTGYSEAAVEHVVRQVRAYTAVAAEASS